MPKGAIQFVADSGQLTAAAAEARKGVSSVAASAEEARKRIVASFDAQIEAAKKAGNSQKQLASIANKSASMFATVTDESARRYINSIDRMEEKTRKFNAARMALGVQPPTPKLPGGGERESVSFREHIHGLSIGGNVGESMLGVAEVLGIVEAANKMRELVAESFEYGEAMSRAAATTGLAVETLSAMHYAAAVTGSDFATMSGAVAKMDRTIGQATEGNKTAIAFIQKLGFNAKELADNPRGAEIAFKKFAETLASTESPIRRVELATALLGRAGADQIPTLIELGENWDEFASKARAAGVVLDAKTANALQATGDRFAGLKEQVKGAGLSFTIALNPALNQMMDVLEGGKSSMNVAAEWGRAMGKILAFVGESAYVAAAGLQLAFGLSEKLIPGQGARGSADLASVRTLWFQAQQMHDIAFGGPNAPRKTPALGTGLGDDAADFLDRNHLGGRGNRLRGGFAGVGDLTGAAASARSKAEEARRKADAQAIKNQEAVHLAWEAAEDRNKASEALYWMNLTSISKGGSATYLNALKHAQEARVVFHREQSEEMRRFQQEWFKDFSDTGGRSKIDNFKLDSGSHSALTYIQALNQGIAGTKLSANAFTESSIQMDVAMGKMTKLDGARAIASLHAKEYAAALKDLKDKRDFIEGGATFVGNPLGQKAALKENENQNDRLDSNRRIQASQDLQSTNASWSNPVAGFRNSLDEFVHASRDSANQIRDLTSNTFEGLNRQIVAAMSGQRTNFGNFGADMFRNVAGIGLNKAEGSILGALGFGGKMGTRSNPMYTISADGIGGAASGLASKVSRGPGGFLNGLLKSFLPGYASGGTVEPNAWSIVGEEGPELFHSGAGGRVLPNSSLKSMGGGDAHNHYYDLRGASVPAQIRAVLMQMTPHIVAVSAQAGARVVHENARRRPSSAR